MVIVRGMQFRTQYIDYGTDAQRPYLELSVKGIGSRLLKALKPGKGRFVERLADQVQAFFDGIVFNPDGSSKNNVSLDTYPGSFANYIDTVDWEPYNEQALVMAACARYGAENVYYFTYDWRLDPYEVAAQINDTVNTALADHNTEKVNLICGSMGGIMTNAYLYRYGSDKINSLVYNSSTVCGTYVTTELLQGKAVANEKALSYLVENLSDKKLVRNFLSVFLVKSGLVRIACKLLNRFINKNRDLIYERTFRPTYGTVPSIWALVQPDELETCIDYMFPTEELKAENHVVIEKARRMAEINRGTADMLRQAQANGCKISLVAGYNHACVPFYESAATQSDGVLESALMLGRATVAEVGDTLGDGYVAADPSKVSPDNMIDLSGALFPENTWAFKNSGHVTAREGSDLTNFAFALIESKVQPTVTNMGVAQFQNVDKNYNFIPY